MDEDSIGVVLIATVVFEEDVFASIEIDSILDVSVKSTVSNGDSV